jgi:predicted kinase
MDRKRSPERPPAQAGYLLQFLKAVMAEITKLSPTLIVLSGLPASGKTVLAESLSRALSVPNFSIDPIEAAMWRAGLPKTQTGIAAYEVAQALADEHLRLRHSAIVDAVNPVEAPRAAWRNLAAKHRVPLKIIECVCSDETMHRQRIESRVRSVAGTHEITWRACCSGVPNTKHGPTPGWSWIRRARHPRSCLRKR